MRSRVLAVIGPGEDATPADITNAETIGALAAAAGWAVLTGGRPAGIMHAALKGARSAGGATLAIIPGSGAAEATGAADYVIATGAGEARNLQVVLSADVLAVCGMNAGTASEVSLALRAGRPLIFIAAREETEAFFRSIAPGRAPLFVHTPNEAIEAANMFQRR